MSADTMLDRLIAWRDGMAVREIRDGAAQFQGLVDDWFEEPHWFCSNGHVSGNYLQSEARGMNCCLACREPVVLGPKIGERAFSSTLRVLSIDL